MWSATKNVQAPVRPTKGMINSTHPKAAPMANPHKNMMARGLAKLQTQANDPYDTDGDNDTWDSMDSMRHGKC